MSIIKRRLLVLFLLIYPSLWSQDTTAVISDLERTFMPQFQLGYVFNQTEDLSGGLMTQTSIEYRDFTNLVFRVNFDVINASMNLSYPLNDSSRFTGKTTFSDLIGGIGYRFPSNKHHLTVYAQSGVRFYGYPLLIAENNQISIDLDRRYAGVMRYTLGYEYQITPKLFFSLELFSSHVFKSRDFWEDHIWAHGITFGLTSPLF